MFQMVFFKEDIFSGHDLSPVFSVIITQIFQMVMHRWDPNTGHQITEKIKIFQFSKSIKVLGFLNPTSQLQRTAIWMQLRNWRER